jgi:hypothetical protein
MKGSYAIRTGGGASNWNAYWEYKASSDGEATSNNFEPSAIGMITLPTSIYQNLFDGEAAFSLDLKVDDGKGATGKLAIYDRCTDYGDPQALNSGVCNNGDTSFPFIYGNAPRSCNLIYWINGGGLGFGSYPTSC